MGCIRCKEDEYTEVIPTTHNQNGVPVIRLCAPGKTSTNFADVGDKIVLYVDFGPSCKPCQAAVDTVDRLERVREAAALSIPDGHHQRRHQHEVVLAGVLTGLKCLHPAEEGSKSYKAVVKIPSNAADRFTEGACIPVKLPYMTTAAGGQDQYREITERDPGIEPAYAVYFQALWKQLKDYNKNVMIESSKSHSSIMGRYGSMASRRAGLDIVDNRQESASETDAVRIEGQQRERRQNPKRLWPDSWEMRCYHQCCKCIMRSDKPIPRFIATFFVAPLTNVTNLSLRYQLYLSEIFHTRFGTRFFHYLCMPLIVLMMLIFSAQLRIGEDTPTYCYRTNNFEVVIINGSLLLCVLFFLWYVIWGIIQRTFLMGFFMIGPLTILYILSNIYFQVSIKNSFRPHKTPACNECWPHSAGSVQIYNSFNLMVWYYNPVLWVWVFCSIQAFSHVFEPKIPPRVNQTAHWMSCSQICKRIGYTNTLCILSAQAIFGTIDEFLAAPRLLPIFVLRLCYGLGYQPDEWELMQTLVEKCQEFGDPALDYIGTGGALYISEHSIVYKSGVHIDELKKEVKSMKHALTPQQKKLLESPNMLSAYKNREMRDPFLEHYMVLKHYVAQYTLQVYAYGPFRSNHDDEQAKIDNDRMERDFGHNQSFLHFLKQVRFALWNMEDDIIEKRMLSACCKAQEEV